METEENKIIFDLSKTDSKNYLGKGKSYYFGKLNFIEKNRNQPKYLLYIGHKPLKLKCPNCESYDFNLNLDNRFASNIIANKLPSFEIDRIKGTGVSYKINCCLNCDYKYYFGFGYHEKQPGLIFEFIHNIIELKIQINRTIASILEDESNYFDYFKKAINYGVNYYEYNFVLGDSASKKLFYLEKSECTDSMEALVRLVIPYLYYNGSFRKSDLKVTESIFEIVKQDLKNDIYWNTVIKNGNISQLKKDLYFPNDDKVAHFEYVKDGKWIEKNESISEIVNECLNSTKRILLTEWSPSFEYFLETDKYFVLYNFSTGA